MGSKLLQLFLALALSLPWAFRARGTSAAGPNLLVNPSWENGFHRQDGVPEFTVPDGWTLWYLDNATFPGIEPGRVAYRPETVVWPASQAPDSERNLFWLDGLYTLKIFKGFAPVYTAISQDVSGLVVGKQYRFTAPVYADIVPGSAKVPPEDLTAAGVRLGVSQVGAPWRNESQTSYTPWANGANTPGFYFNYVHHTLTFTATSTRMTVWVEMMGRYALGNNGFFLDNFSLAPVEAAPAPPLASPTVTPTTAPTVAPTPTIYVVQPGDYLFLIARKFGTTVAALLQLNPLPNPSLLYVGTRLIIPSGSTVAPTPTPPVTTVPPSGKVTVYAVRPGDTLFSLANRFGTSTAELSALNRLPASGTIFVGQVLKLPASATNLPDKVLYTVQPGDNLYRIGLRFGTTASAIYNANSLTTGIIRPGQLLVIP